MKFEIRWLWLSVPLLVLGIIFSFFIGLGSALKVLGFTMGMILSLFIFGMFINYCVKKAMGIEE